MRAGMMGKTQVELRRTYWGNMMKKTMVMAGLMALFLTGCGVNTSSNIDFDGDDIGYAQDQRTGLCYAYTASRMSGNVDTSGLGLTEVPCSDKVLRLVQ